MAVQIVAKVAASTTLDDLNTIVSQREDTTGPLTGIGSRKGLTELTFSVGTSPTSHATIAVDVNGEPSVPDGSTVIDTDLIFIAGQISLCTASRPSA